MLVGWIHIKSRDTITTMKIKQTLTHEEHTHRTREQFIDSYSLDNNIDDDIYSTYDIHKIIRNGFSN